MRRIRNEISIWIRSLLISNEISATPLIIHHDNRENSMRGASAILDWARIVIKLEDASYQGEKRIRLVHEKCNNHKLFDPFILRMDKYLNFSAIDLEGAVLAKDLERCRQVRKALELLGGSTETQGQP